MHIMCGWGAGCVLGAFRYTLTVTMLDMTGGMWPTPQRRTIEEIGEAIQLYRSNPERAIGDLGFEKWVDNEAMKSLASYLTVVRLLEKFEKEFDKVVSYHCLRRALVRIGFKYQKRYRSFVSSKWRKEILEHFAMHCARVWLLTAYDETTGRWYFKDPTLFSDEAYLLGGEIRSMSWCRNESKYRNAVRGGFKRFCMILTIMSHKGTTKGEAGVLRFWNMAWKPKPGRAYSGACTNDTILKYFGDDVFTELGEPVEGAIPTLYLDNWSVHKKFEEEFDTKEFNYAWNTSKFKINA